MELKLSQDVEFATIPRSGSSRSMQQIEYQELLNQIIG